LYAFLGNLKKTHLVAMMEHVLRENATNYKLLLNREQKLFQKIISMIISKMAENSIRLPMSSQLFNHR